MLTCPSCGKTVADENPTFCPHCGTQLNVGNVTRQPITETGRQGVAAEVGGSPQERHELSSEDYKALAKQHRRTRRRSNIIKAVAGVAILALVIAGIISILLRHSPSTFTIMILVPFLDMARLAQPSAG